VYSIVVPESYWKKPILGAFINVSNIVGVSVGILRYVFVALPVGNKGVFKSGLYALALIIFSNVISYVGPKVV